MDYEIILLGFKGYDFQDSANKRQVGAKISYLTNYVQNDDLKKGNLPIQEQVELPFILSCYEGVGIYLVKTTTVPGKNNMPVSKIVSMSFVRSVDISKIFLNK